MPFWSASVWWRVPPPSKGCRFSSITSSITTSSFGRKPEPLIVNELPKVIVSGSTVLTTTRGGRVGKGSVVGLSGSLPGNNGGPDCTFLDEISGCNAWHPNAAIARIARIATARIQSHRRISHSTVTVSAACACSMAVIAISIWSSSGCRVVSD